jgi:glycosyltransferase involved in cell wall biosynthesis
LQKVYLILAFDTSALSNQLRYSGIHRYSVTLLREFKKIADANPSVALRVFSSNGHSDEISNLKPSSGVEVLHAPGLQHSRFWTLGGLALAALRAGADLVFSPSFYTCPWGPVPTVVTIHDVTPLTSPTWFGWTNRVERVFLWNAVKFSRKLVADSECTRNDLIRSYGVHPEKAAVVYLGYDKDRFNTIAPETGEQGAVFARCQIRSPYILHHGTIQPRKNLERLIQSYRLLIERCPDLGLDLVLGGPLGWHYDQVVRAANESAGPGRVMLTGPVTEHELPLLVKGAALCVIPSLYEGFCLPMVEAMACGIPTIVSNASCLPEVSGGMLRYFDPISIEDMVATMEKALCDSNVRRELTANGIRRASEFSWERCARETLNVLASCHENRE